MRLLENTLTADHHVACSRKIILDRLLELGMEQLRLPLGVSSTEKHLPILISKGLKEKKHVIVVFPERHIDAGILSYRLMGEESINRGSIVNFVKSVLGIGSSETGQQRPGQIESPSGLPDLRSKDIPGIVIANPSQLIWFRGGSRVVTDREWLCLPRISPIYGPMRVDEEKNRIEGNKDFKQHVRYLFDHVLSNTDDEPKICHTQAKFSIIGQEYVGSEVLYYLAGNWHTWKNRVNCVALINPQHELEELFEEFDMAVAGDRNDRDEIEDFIARRTRAYRLSHHALEALIPGRDRLGCNVYAAGETLYEESCFVRCWPSILDWIEMCRVSETYAEPYLVIENQDEKDASPKTRTYQRRILDEGEAQKVGYHELKIEQ